MRLFAVLASVAFLVATPALALDDPAALIRQLYRTKNLPDTPAQADRFLARDMAAAYKRQLADSENAGAAVDFDWRWDTQDELGTDLTIAEKFVARPGRNKAGRTTAPRAIVVASFKREGESLSIGYDLCLGPKGWRIADAWDQERQWSLRDLLELKGKPLRC